MDIQKELDEIFEDDLLKCEIVESVENSARRVDLIRWTHDGTFSIAEVRRLCLKYLLRTATKYFVTTRNQSNTAYPLGNRNQFGATPTTEQY